MPWHEHAGQGDPHGGAGEEDRAAGGVHRLLDGGGDLAAVLAVGVAVAGDDEERVVDADAEPDHQRELGGEVGLHLEELAEILVDGHDGDELVAMAILIDLERLASHRGLRDPFGNPIRILQQG